MSDPRRYYWQINRELRAIEGVRRCIQCAGREDLHNDPRYMAGLPEHAFDAPSPEELAEWDLAY